MNNSQKKEWKPAKVCRHRGHEPPTMIYIPPGQTRKHVCPACGKETIMKGNPVGYLSS